MRIIAGLFRSRRIKAVPGMLVRPTPDRLRETLFDVLGTQVENAIFLDAYAGSGAVGLEALSRGARQVILIERNSEALGVIRENVEELGVQRQVMVVRGNAAAQMKRHASEIAFVDPPYDRTVEYANALMALDETGCRLTIAQHSSRFALEEQYGSLRRTRVLRQGDNSLSFYRREQDNAKTEGALSRENDTDVHDVSSGGTSADEIAEGIEVAI